MILHLAWRYGLRESKIQKTAQDDISQNPVKPGKPMSKGLSK